MYTRWAKRKGLKFETLDYLPGGDEANLYQRKLDEQQAELDEIRGEQKEIGLGSQIRTYVFHPYSIPWLRTTIQIRRSAIHKLSWQGTWIRSLMRI